MNNLEINPLGQLFPAGIERLRECCAVETSGRIRIDVS